MIVDGNEEYVVTVIMAAGLSTRMKSNKSKLVQKIYDKELIKRVVETANSLKTDKVIAVVGYMKEQIEDLLKDTVEYVYQEELLGSGHAVMQAKPYLEGKKGKVLVLCGDVPIIKQETLLKLISKSIKDHEYATLLTTITNNPTGYGRIIRDEYGNVRAIVEEKDANDLEKEIKEINSGIYCFDIEELLNAINYIKPENAQGEYYLTDVIQIMNEKGLKMGAISVDNQDEVLGVNDRVQLENATRALRNRINLEHMNNGVTIEDSNSTYIYDNVTIGRDTVIHPNTTIKEGVIIGENCEIGPNAYIREGCVIGNDVKIGNFVELKKAKIGDRTKVPHFIYLGDTEIGIDSNVGCGTITCNYDGINKHKTIIGDRAFIGSNTNFVAPVTIGNDVVIAAGSTITEDVPSNMLGIARERQINKPRKNNL